MRDYLENSKTEYLLQDGWRIYNSERLVKLRIIHDILTDYFIDWLSKVFQDQFREQLNSLELNLRVMTSLYMAFLGVGCLFAVAYSWMSIKRELNICCETFIILSPEIVLSNPMLSNTYNKLVVGLKS